MTIDAQAAEYQRRAEELERSPAPVLLKIARVLVWIIWAIVAVQAAILVIAFFLRLFGANPEAGFSEWIYRSTERAMRPFRGIFPERELSDTSVFDGSLLFAAICYLLLAALIDAGLHWIKFELVKRQREAENARRAADALYQQAAQERALAERYAAQQYAAAQAVAQEVVAAQQSPQGTRGVPRASVAPPQPPVPPGPVPPPG